MLYHFPIMKNKKTVKISILIAITFTLLYIIFAAKPLAKEYQFSPEWKINTSNPTIKDSQKDKMYFRLGQTLGYFTEDGDISLFKTFPAKASISNSFYATYDSNAKNTDFYFCDGRKAGTIQAAGYPFFKDNLIFAFLPGGNSFAKCNENGEIAWTYQGTMPLTAFSTNANFTVAGLADGTIHIFNNDDGKIVSTFIPGGSQYPVILGIDISDDGQYVASISGHDQQRFVLSHKEAAQQKIIFHTFLNTDSPYQTIVHFCKDGKRVLYNYDNNLGIYDISTGQNTVIKLASKVLSVDENDDFVFLLGKNKDTYTVSIIEKTNTLLGAFSFQAETAFIHSQGTNLFVGKDNSISKLSIVRE